MIINDLVILGRACPEPLKDGRVTVCLGGWSETQGFVRLYPTRFDTPWKRWDVVRVDVERNPSDTRIESWKITGSKGEWETLSEKIEVVGSVKSTERRRNLIGNLADSCVNVINDAHRSLGIVKPIRIDPYFADNPLHSRMWQLGLPGLTELDGVEVKRDFPYEPRLRFSCPECQTKSGYHDMVVLEWGFYRWIIKNPERRDQVWENAGIGQPGRDIYLFVGNQFAHRTSFLVISVLRFPSGPFTPTLFPMRKTPPE
jgi:hypothetical protein